MAADRALGHAVTRSGRERERDAVVGPVVQIALSVSETLTPPADPDTLAELALGAALAALVEDMLEGEAYGELMRPFG
ncbi:MAG: hypothetical protein ABIS29_06580 [Vicinamibacterales bacterium]